jgi:mono/diheme cytochrome c family protein
MSDPIEPPPGTPDPELHEGSHEKPSQVEKYHVSLLHSPILRERSEPRDGYEPVPLWLAGLFGVLLFWGGWYLSEYSGGWDGANLDPRPEARFAGAVVDKGPVDPMELGKKLFTAHCVSCHQQSGQGVAGQYPPLVGSPWVLENPQHLKRILLLGLQGEITVAGATYNGNMPAFGARLSDEQVGAVLTYIRNSWGNSAGPIPAESVAATRKAIEGRTAPWTAAELAAITAPDWTAPPPDAKDDAQGD